MTPDDARLVHALASGLCQAEAATLAGVSRATVTRRLRDAGFCQAVDELRADHVRRVGHRLGELSTKALGAFEELLADRDAPAQRLGASRAVLDGLLRLPGGRRDRGSPGRIGGPLGREQRPSRGSLAVSFDRRRLERLEGRHGRRPDTTTDAQREHEHAALDREIELLLAEMARRELDRDGDGIACDS